MLRGAFVARNSAKKAHIVGAPGSERHLVLLNLVYFY